MGRVVAAHLLQVRHILVARVIHLLGDHAMEGVEGSTAWSCIEIWVISGHLGAEFIFIV
jgi:hypothetical protein